MSYDIEANRLTATDEDAMRRAVRVFLAADRRRSERPTTTGWRIGAAPTIAPPVTTRAGERIAMHNAFRAIGCTILDMRGVEIDWVEQMVRDEIERDLEVVRPMTTIVTETDITLPASLPARPTYQGADMKAIDAIMEEVSAAIGYRLLAVKMSGYWFVKSDDLPGFQSRSFDYALAEATSRVVRRAKAE